MTTDQELRKQVATDPFHTGLENHGEARWDPRREGGQVCGMSDEDIAAAAKRVNETPVNRKLR